MRTDSEILDARYRDLSVEEERRLWKIRQPFDRFKSASPLDIIETQRTLEKECATAGDYLDRWNETTEYRIASKVLEGKISQISWIVVLEFVVIVALVVYHTVPWE